MSSPSIPGGSVGLYSGFTRLCKGLAVVLVAGHLTVQILPSSLSYLALIPAKTIPFGWNLITAGYIEQSVYGVVVSAICLLIMGKLLEPVWGSKEFLKFIFIVNFLTSVCVFITAIALYYITRQENYLYMPISGFQGVLSGFLVGMKQIIPDQEISLLRIKAKWFPSLALLLAIAVSFFTPESTRYLPTITFGTYLSWIYLRYLQRKPEAKLRGDPNDDFAFSTFFPEFLRPVIDPIASIFHRMLCGRSETSTEADGYTLGGAPLPGSDPIEASRRRERGARALEERLAAERLAAARSSDDSKKMLQRMFDSLVTRLNPKASEIFFFFFFMTTYRFCAVWEISIFLLFFTDSFRIVKFIAVIYILFHDDSSLRKRLSRKPEQFLRNG